MKNVNQFHKKWCDDGEERKSGSGRQRIWTLEGIIENVENIWEQWMTGSPTTYEKNIDSSYETHDNRYDEQKVDDTEERNQMEYMIEATETLKVFLENTLQTLNEEIDKEFEEVQETLRSIWYRASRMYKEDTDDNKRIQKEGMVIIRGGGDDSDDKDDGNDINNNDIKALKSERTAIRRTESPLFRT